MLASILASLMPAEGASTDDQIEALAYILGLATERIIDGGRHGTWLMFVGREKMTPGPAFDMLYDRVIRRLIDLFSTLVGRIIEQPPDSEQALLSTFVLMGPLFIFQRARSVTLRMLDWPRLDPERLQRVKTILVRQILHGLVATGEKPRRR